MTRSANIEANSMCCAADSKINIELFLMVEEYNILVTETSKRLLDLSQCGACYVLKHREEYCKLLEDIIQKTRKKHHRLVRIALEEETQGTFFRVTQYTDIVHKCNILAEQLEKRLTASRAVLGLSI
jgi:hypothetical protein